MGQLGPRSLQQQCLARCLHALLRRLRCCCVPSSPRHGPCCASFLLAVPVPSWCEARFLPHYPRLHQLHFWRHCHLYFWHYQLSFWPHYSRLHQDCKSVGVLREHGAPPVHAPWLPATFRSEAALSRVLCVYCVCTRSECTIP